MIPPVQSAEQRASCENLQGLSRNGDAAVADINPGPVRMTPVTEPAHWFEPIADQLGATYLRYAPTKGTRQEIERVP